MFDGTAVFGVIMAVLGAFCLGVCLGVACANLSR